MAGGIAQSNDGARPSKQVCRSKSDREVGVRGFEPLKAYASRFTVCPLWPLGYTPGLSAAEPPVPAWGRSHCSETRPSVHHSVRSGGRNHQQSKVTATGPSVESSLPAALAQLVEQLTCNEQVIGSSPIRGFRESPRTSSLGVRDG